MNRKPSKDDCLRQCIALVTGRPVHRVPHFVKKYRGRWIWHMMTWCERVGYECIVQYGNGSARGIVSDGIRLWIEIGNTRLGNSHAVVSERGKIIFDGGAALRTYKGAVFILCSNAMGKKR